MEQKGEVGLGFQKVRLYGEYAKPELVSGNGWGRCLNRAFREAAGIDVENMPDWVRVDDLPAICDELGLKLHTGGQNIELKKGKDVIVLYKTAKDRAHAVITDNPNSLRKVEKDIVGIIEVLDKT